MAARVSGDRLLILGLGNVLCADDGLGVAAVEKLVETYQIPANVRIEDGGTLGLSLAVLFEDADDVIFVDAIQTPEPPGSLVRLVGDEVAPAVRDRLSVHQIGVVDLLDVLRLAGVVVRRIVLLGLVPETLELRLGRSNAIQDSMAELVDVVANEAISMGYSLERIDEQQPHPAGRERLTPRALGL